MPHDLVCEWGRGTGKGVVEAGRILYAVQHMPGSCLAMVAPSVKRCQTNILPSALVHLEEWGYKRDVHYIVGKKPWKALHWKDPHFQPMNWENTVAFYNGAYLNIISQDRCGTSNSLSLDHVFIDEAKFIDWEQLNNETLPANRGNKQLFGDCCLHHGLTITSDTSATKKGSWFMQWEKNKIRSWSRRSSLSSCSSIAYVISWQRTQSVTTIICRRCRNTRRFCTLCVHTASFIPDAPASRTWQSSGRTSSDR